jgi:hypothetical protein
VEDWKDTVKEAVFEADSKGSAYISREVARPEFVEEEARRYIAESWGTRRLDQEGDPFTFEADANGVLIRKLDASTPEGRFRRDLFE